MNVGELCLAALKGDNDKVKKILKDGKVSVNDKNTALIWASQNGHLEVVKLLVVYRANVNEKDKNGNSSLLSASLNGHLEVVKFLLANGANLNDKGKYGKTALMQSSGQGHINLVKYLLEKGMAVNGKDDDEQTALMLSSENGHIEIVKYLLANGANLNDKDKYGRNALMLANIFGYFEVVKYLLTNGAIVNEINSYGTTALMLASQYGHLQLVKYLLEKGADPTIRTNENHPRYKNLTATDIARRENKPEVAVVLEKAESDFQERKRNEDEKEKKLKEIKNLVSSGDKNLKEGNFDDAIEFFQKAIILDTEIAAKYRAQENLALAKLKQKELSEQLKEVEEWLRKGELSFAFGSLKDFGVEKMQDLSDLQESDIEKFSISAVKKRKLWKEIAQLKGISPNFGKEEVSMTMMEGRSTSQTSDPNKEALVSSILEIQNSSGEHRSFMKEFDLEEDSKSGGFHTIFFAKTKYSKEKVVLKTYNKKEDLNCELRAIEVLGTSYSPKVFRYLRDEVNQPPYILAIERCEINLRDYLNKQRSYLDRGNAILICNQIASAIAALHQAHIVHCDLKPENVMCRSLIEFHWLLIDFDSSSMISNPVRNQTAQYLAPEVLTGGDKTPATEAIDVWAFGCIMFEIFTRRPLFPTGEEGMQSLCKQRKENAKLFDSFPEEIPRTIQDLLFDILVEQPQKRPRMKEILQRPPFMTYTIAVKEARNEGRVQAIETLSPKLEAIQSGVEKTLRVAENVLSSQEELSSKIERIFDELDDLKTLVVETPNADTPRLFIVLPAEKPTGNWRQWLSSLKSIRAHQLRLYLVCECEWLPHCMEQSYPIEEPRKFFKKAGPILGVCFKAFNVLASLSPIHVPGVPKEVTDWLSSSGNSPTEYFDLMKELVDYAIHKKAPREKIASKELQTEIRTQAARDQLYREFSVFLDKLDPGKKRSSLSRRAVKLRSGKENFLWLCDQHIAEYSSKNCLLDTNPFQNINKNVLT